MLPCPACSANKRRRTSPRFAPKAAALEEVSGAPECTLPAPLDCPSGPLSAPEGAAPEEMTGSPEPVLPEPADCPSGSLTVPEAAAPGELSGAPDVILPEPADSPSERVSAGLPNENVHLSDRAQQEQMDREQTEEAIRVVLMQEQQALGFDIGDEASQQALFDSFGSQAHWQSAVDLFPRQA